MVTESNTKSPIRIAVVDDHQLYRRSMVMLINSFEDMQVVLDAQDGQSLLDQILSCPVDVVLLDIQMPVMNGYETCKHLLHLYPQVKILMVSFLITKQSVQKFFEIGAHGYLTKGASPEDLKAAIQTVNTNGFHIGSELGNALSKTIKFDKKKGDDKLNKDTRITDRELDVVSLMCKELTSHEIAAQLFISIRSMDAHRRSIMKKTNSQNVAGIILYVLKQKLISLDDL